MITIYTDGSCDPNPGPGGWGFVILRNNEILHEGFGGDSDTTNNKMEITAVIKALESLHEKKMLSTIEEGIIIYSDSKYVVNGTSKWIDNWIKNDFKTKPYGNQPSKKILNENLWRQIWDLRNKTNMDIYHIKGHSGIRWNEYVDNLAVKGRLQAIGIDLEEKPPTEIKKVLIDPHYCSREEYEELIQYLNENCWDYKLLK